MSAPCKADHAAAERLLKAAVKEAIATYRRNDSPHDVVLVADMFDAATRSAGLLLGEAS